MVVLRRDEDLALAGQPPERGRVMDAVEVALEAGPVRVGLLGPGPAAGAHGPGRAGRQGTVLGLLAGLPADGAVPGRADHRSPVRVHDVSHGDHRTQGVCHSGRAVRWKILEERTPEADKSGR